MDTNVTKCCRCQWWVQIEDDAESEGYGRCYRMPPIPFKSMKGNTPKEVAVSCTFPVTSYDTFCGEFKSGE
jgi:hypothetical protein